LSGNTIYQAHAPSRGYDARTRAINKAFVENFKTPENRLV